MNSREKRIRNAQLRVLGSVPFFAPGVARLPVVFDLSVPTACTEGKVIRWNPYWFDKLEDKHLVTVLCHEVCHALMGHLWRAPAGASAENWNVACDHAVNLMLEEFGQLVTAKRLADPFPFPPGACCKDPAYRGMSEEKIYSLLPKSGGGSVKGNSPGGGGSGKPGGAAHQPFGEFELVEVATPAQKQQKTAWEHALIQSCQMGKGQGMLPAGMARVLGDFLDPKVPWWELLRQWLREQASDDWNWQKPNQYFGDSEFILPVLESEKIGPVVFATDTSGSIDNEALGHFQTEKQSCLDDLRPAKLVDIYCDAKIHKVAEYRVGDQISKEAPGGGGTDFRPVFRHVEGMTRAPKCLVFLTDLWGTFPDEAPEYPVLWCLWGDKRKAPFGEVIPI